MAEEKTLIQIRRTNDTWNNLQNESIEYGEFVFLENDDTHKKKYLAVGNKEYNDTSDTDVDEVIRDATIFEGVTNSALVGHSVYWVYDSNGNKIIVDRDSNSVGTNKIYADKLDLNTDDTNKYYLLSTDSTGNTKYVGEDNGIYITGNGVLNGTSWNDYAERRTCNSGTFGQVVCENGDGTLSLSKEKLQPLPYVISDTAGFILGEEKSEKDLPLALSGRALVQVNCEVNIGDVLCADKDGYATSMTRFEIANYPDRILGIVSEIPTYPTWNDIEINNRVWVTIK